LLDAPLSISLSFLLAFSMKLIWVRSASAKSFSLVIMLESILLVLVFLAYSGLGLNLLIPLLPVASSTNLRIFMIDIYFMLFWGISIGSLLLGIVVTVSSYDVKVFSFVLVGDISSEWWDLDLPLLKAFWALFWACFSRRYLLSSLSWASIDSLVKNCFALR
jgi:hypothetical protein